MNTPWNNPKLKPAKLLSIDEQDMTTHIKMEGHYYYCAIDLSLDLNTLLDIGHYYGITVFLNENGTMVDYSYITEDMLTPVRKIKQGVDVYE